MTSFEPGSKGTCPYCNTTSARFDSVKGRALSPMLPGGLGYTTVALDGLFSTATETIRIIGSACPECGRIIIAVSTLHALPLTPAEYAVDGEFVVWPRYSSRPVPNEVPKPIADDYKEAATLVSISPKASAALSRRCLQAVLREAGNASQHDLMEQIKAVLPTLPPYLREQVDAIRNIGNFAAHPAKDQNSGLLIDVEPGESEWNLDVLDMLFEFYYVQPAQVAQKKIALNAKLAASGKAPMK
jgi:hypothetical protein